MQQVAAFLYMLLFLLVLRAGAQSFVQPAAYAVAYSEVEKSTDVLASAPTAMPEKKDAAITRLLIDINGKKRASRTIGYTKRGWPVAAYYFPGRSNGRALVIGGVHGTERASTEVAKHLVRQLAAGDTPFYSVLIIPSLFPDNAALALEKGAGIRSLKNIGRYSHACAADPNRQMPALGTPYNPETNTDALGRPIEYENGLLLQLIQAYKPQRMVNIHAIRDTAHGGIYADPRTDAKGRALGFEPDSSIAVSMARYIEQAGGGAPGNKLANSPTALYYKDPPAAEAGQWQKRNRHGSSLPHNRGQGVSLGSWASTAVSDAVLAENNRPAIRLFTMEFPGYKRPQDYAEAQQPYVAKQVQLYAAAIKNVFLTELLVEDDAAMANRF